jgi:monoamine oxidase
MAGRRDPVGEGLGLLAGLFPAAEKCFTAGQIHDWTKDPFSRGGFSHLRPGYVMKHLRSIAQPEGRVHFAGEHTAAWSGFMEGALESAERVTEEVLREGFQ